MKKGFTLIELLVVIGLISAISSVAIMGYSRLYSGFSEQTIDANKKVISSYLDSVYFLNNNNINIDTILPNLQVEIYIENPVTGSTAQEVATLIDENTLSTSADGAVIYIVTEHPLDEAKINSILKTNNMKGTVIVNLTPTTYTVAGN